MACFWRLLIGNALTVLFLCFTYSVGRYRSSSSSTSLIFGNLLLAIITIASCSKPLNTYSYQDVAVNDDNGAQYEQQCVLTTSSYNAIYSDGAVHNDDAI